MKTKKLGCSNLELTRVGLGAWAMGGSWQVGWGAQDDEDSIKTILIALDSGINWIDTAAIYGLGHSEEVVGKALKQIKDKPLIATKCSLVWDNQKNISNCLKTESVREECHASLKRLGIDVIDLYQIHLGAPDEQIEEGWEAMVKLVEDGKVRHIGVSNFSVEQMQRVQNIHPIASLQPPYSMIRREIEKEILGFCGENNIGVICYSPMARGLLTGKFSKKRMASLPDDDHRKGDPQFQGPTFSATMELVEQLKPIAKSNGITLGQLAVGWVLRRDEVTAAIVGARRPEQAKENAQAAEVVLGQNDLEKIEQLLTQWQGKTESD